MPNRYPIVGAFFRPPAQALLDFLKLDTVLFLWAEPENPKDPNAIAVYLPSEALATMPEDVDAALSLSGNNLEELRTRGQDIQLGYIPKHFAASLRGHGFPVNKQIPGTFTLNAEGQPRILWEDEPFRPPGT